MHLGRVPRGVVHKKLLVGLQSHLFLHYPRVFRYLCNAHLNIYHSPHHPLPIYNAQRPETNSKVDPQSSGMRKEEKKRRVVHRLAPSSPGKVDARVDEDTLASELLPGPPCDKLQLLLLLLALLLPALLLLALLLLALLLELLLVWLALLLPSLLDILLLLLLLLMLPTFIVVLLTAPLVSTPLLP